MSVALPGANVWESDAAGLQLGVGGVNEPKSLCAFEHEAKRSPHCGGSFGYPERIHLLIMVEEVQWVSGAAALQYGSQLGGMLNFVMRPALRCTNCRPLDDFVTCYAPRNGEYRGHRHVFAEATGQAIRQAIWWRSTTNRGAGGGTTRV